MTHLPHEDVEALKLSIIDMIKRDYHLIPKNSNENLVETNHLLYHLIEFISRKEAIEKRRKELSVIITGLVTEANNLKSELAQIVVKETHINDLLK